jgi:hypothetical protein
MYEPFFDYISENEAVEIAKGFVPKEQYSWSVDLEKEVSPQPVGEFKDTSNPVYKVTATYKQRRMYFIYLDAVTGEFLSLKNLDAAKVENNLLNLESLSEHFNPNNLTYEGEIIVTLSEQAKTRLENGSTVIVTVSGKETLSNEPIHIQRVDDSVAIPFKFKLNQNMIDKIRLILSIDEINLEVLQKDLSLLIMRNFLY